MALDGAVVRGHRNIPANDFDRKDESVPGSGFKIRSRRGNEAEIFGFPGLSAYP
jgi:hypothetical protein